MSYYDVKCPYCNAEQEINHDDGYGYAEDQIYQQECEECGKTFTFTTSISYYYDVEECPCANGEEHKWIHIHGCPVEYYKKRYRCEYCDEEKELTDEEIAKL